MSGSLDRPVTWGSLLRVGLAFGAEYGVLSLIEDAPVALKIATVICSILALITLESKTALTLRHRYAFTSAIGFIAIVYAGFAAYAVQHSINRIATRHGLERIYTEAAELPKRSMKILNGNGLDQRDVAQFASDFDSWNEASARWIETHISAAARERFLDTSNMPLYGWPVRGPAGEEAHDVRFEDVMNRIANERKNLAILIETSAYE